MIKVKSVTYFPSTYELIKKQFEGTGICFESCYLLEDNIPLLYEQIQYKITSVSNTQTDLRIGETQCYQYDPFFNYDIYQITPNSALKLRRFIFSILSEKDIVVNSILITGFDFKTNQEIGFCHVILEEPILVGKYEIFDFDFNVVYPVPISTHIGKKLYGLESRTDYQNLFDSVKQNMKSFTCGEIFTSNIDIDCFYYFDLFNYYQYVSSEFVNKTNQQSSQGVSSSATIPSNQPLQFTVNSLNTPVLNTNVSIETSENDIQLIITTKIPLNITNKISSLKIANDPSSSSVLNFKKVVICKNYINAGHKYFTVQIGVNLSKWMKYVTFLTN